MVSAKIPIPLLGQAHIKSLRLHNAIDWIKSRSEYSSMRHGHRDVGHNSTIVAGTVLLRDLGHVLYVDPTPLDYVNSELASLLGVSG